MTNKINWLPTPLGKVRKDEGMPAEGKCGRITQRGAVSLLIKTYLEGEALFMP
jgi:hypothetical protein